MQAAGAGYGGGGYGRGAPPPAPIEYLCADCAAPNEIKAREPIRCRQCGCRMMYKKRVKRSDHGNNTASQGLANMDDARSTWETTQAGGPPASTETTVPSNDTTVVDNQMNEARQQIRFASLSSSNSVTDAHSGNSSSTTTSDSTRRKASPPRRPVRSPHRTRRHHEQHLTVNGHAASRQDRHQQEVHSMPRHRNDDLTRARDGQPASIPTDPHGSSRVKNKSSPETPTSPTMPSSSSSTSNSGAESFRTARDSTPRNALAAEASGNGNTTILKSRQDFNASSSPGGVSFLRQVSSDPISFGSDSMVMPDQVASATQQDPTSPIMSVRQLVYSARTVPRARQREFTHEEEEALSRRELERRDDGLGILGVFGENSEPRLSTSSHSSSDNSRREGLLASPSRHAVDGGRASGRDRPRSSGSSSSAGSAAAKLKRGGAPSYIPLSDQASRSNKNNARPSTLRRPGSGNKSPTDRATTPPSPLAPPILPPGLSPTDEDDPTTQLFATRPMTTSATRRERSPLRSVTPAESWIRDSDTTTSLASSSNEQSRQQQQQSSSAKNSFKRLSIALGVSKSQSCPPGVSLNELGTVKEDRTAGSRRSRAGSSAAVASSNHNRQQHRQPEVKVDTSSLTSSSSARSNRAVSPLLLPSSSQSSPLHKPRSRATSSPGLGSLPSPSSSSLSTSPLSPSTLSVPSLTSPHVTSFLSPSPSQIRTWRSTISAEEYDIIASTCGSTELKRQEVIWELVETETLFVDSFKSVVELFALPLKKAKKGTWLEGVPVPVARLFDWASDIIYFHTQILQAMMSARHASLDKPLVMNMAASILPFVPRFEIYQPYLVRFEKVTQIIEDLVNDPKNEFGEFVRMQSNLPECRGLSLASYLLKPVQRLMKYPLFFKQLVELTPQNHGDRVDTVKLFESTDFIIRVMQEVKSREDEYDNLKTLQSRLRGLPSNFRLARRDRKLVHQGPMRRIHINDRDRILLDADARAVELSNSAAAGDDSPPMLPAMPTPMSSLSGAPSRPYSGISTDSGSSGNQDDFFAFASPLSSYESPTSMSSLSGTDSLRRKAGSRPFANPGAGELVRPISLTSFASSASASNSDDSSTVVGTTRSGTVMHPSVSSPLQLQHAVSGQPKVSTKRILKTKGKQTLVHMFVFSDLVILATKANETTKWSSKIVNATPRKKSLSNMNEDDMMYNVLETVGVSRVLGLADYSGKTEHEHLIKLDLLNVSAGSLTPLSLGSYHSLSKAIFLSLPTSLDSPLASAPTLAARAQWISAFEQPCLHAYRSISPSTLLTTPITHKERLSAAAGTTPGRSPPPIGAAILSKSPSETYIERFQAVSQGHEGPAGDDRSSIQPHNHAWLDVADSPREVVAAEREERTFWRTRFETIKHEMQQPLQRRRSRRDPALPTSASQLTGADSIVSLPVAMSNLFLDPMIGPGLPPGADAPRRSSFTS
ncbi:hypothetical protein OIO90_002298 [Microbotryomycetes sp. JL221]|nr:hypothetical protein OIO90_002298 [Microbotryomycetes sp. JL221]